ncbi:glycoside hydrolase family 37 protein [Apodospora peruviana]|uniref:Trehalase n=1 Tax=Apodospora peruviana TaxID=516989 RepID=A0AAE0MES0_9PEZI|nr:glycoside hydrolase family 37 protein [Apodospora peruviana]
MAPRRIVAALALLTSTATALYINGSVTAPCDSPLYCQGGILKAIELARPFSDSKTFVDMPTLKPLDEVIAAFEKLTQPLSNNTELQDFLHENFGRAGGELKAVSPDELKTNATFLDNVEDTVIKQFVEAVIKIWPDLTREYVGGGNCTGCVDSFIPVNRTFVVAGGRFREPYYWDSYWILEGLLRTGGSFIEISKNTIENFLDFVETIGFVPNGARIYYLNRSQPPLLTQMVRIYIEHTNDTGILERAVPLLIKEHEFWMTNRTVDIEGQDGKTYTLNRYHVDNNQPRPESYREDWITATNNSYYATSGIIYPETSTLNDTEKSTLYANLASGAESGWDYGTRYLARPNDAAEDVYFPLRSLNVLEIVPLDLNSILYQNEVTISNFLKLSGNESAADEWANLAEKRSEAMYTLMWNSSLWSYFDYNLTSNSQNIYIPADEDAAPLDTAGAPKGQQVIFHVASFFPFWTGAAPDQLKNNPLAVQQAFKRVDDMLERKAGAIPATNFLTGQQWDEPNVWPPLMHVLMNALVNVPATFGEDDPAYIAVQDLAVRLGQRYLDSTFCTWRVTGGSTTETPKLQGLGPEAVGIMFEKYGDNSTNAAGGGGEYEVVEGFGWTNGVLLWAADTFAGKLKRPECGNITAANVSPEPTKRSPERRAVELDSWDSKWTKKFGRRVA